MSNGPSQNPGTRHHLPFRSQRAAGHAPVIVLISCLLVGFVLFFEFSIPWHNLRLARLERQVRDALLHPDGSRLILRRKIVENLGGTGNQCHFAVVELRAGGDSPGSLKRFYAGRSLKDPDTDEPLKVQLRLQPIAPDDQIGAVDPITRLTSAAERASSDYALAIVGWSEPGCDFRCE